MTMKKALEFLSTPSPSVVVEHLSFMTKFRITRVNAYLQSPQSSGPKPVEVGLESEDRWPTVQALGGGGGVRLSQSHKPGKAPHWGGV